MIVVGGVAGLIAGWFVAALSAVLIAWIVAAVTFLVWVWGTIGSFDADATKQFATREDDSRVSAQFLLLAACVASLVGVGVELAEAGGADDAEKAAFTVGMTFQVSDTDVQSRNVRRTVINHALLAYLFGAVILALTVNIAATLLQS